MTRRSLLATTLLPAALLLFSSSASARQVPRPNEEAPPPSSLDALRLPRPPHEAGLPSTRGGDGRPPQTLTKEEKRLLAVPREDRELYADFLRGSRTGLVRLLPRESFDGRLPLRGGGAYYSFVRREHRYGYGSDISLERGQFLVGFAGADFGFLVDLGDTPLEWVSTETEAVRFMADFETPSAERDAREIQGRLFRRRGQQVGSWTYSRSLPAVIGNTYAVRSVNYDRSDVLVAFRVLRQDENGSVVLLWKMLQKFPTPLLRREAATRR